ncbi:MAG: bacteriocin [Bacteroidetes bacterium]|nr:bacteriocin [Bacteroidota bacterium]
MEQLKHTGIKSLNHNELTNIEGGGLAYDVGRALRFMGINIGNGGGPVGISEAISDYIIVELKNQ